jgi:hypothetical protein
VGPPRVGPPRVGPPRVGPPRVGPPRVGPPRVGPSRSRPKLRSSPLNPCCPSRPSSPLLTQGITDDDLLALVSDEVHKPETVWELIDLQVGGVGAVG